MNPFGTIQLSEYRTPYRSLPVQEFSKSMEHLEHRYDQNLLATEKLREHVESLNVEAQNKDILQGAAGKLYGTLNSLIEGDNLEYAEQDLLRSARDFKSTPLLKEALEDHAAFQAWHADIKERNLDIEDPERIAQHQALYRKNAKRLEYDENGNVINRFNLGRPVDTADLAGQALEFLEKWKSDEIIGADVGNPTTVRANMNISESMYDKTRMYLGFLRSEFRDGSKMEPAVIQHLMSDPKNVAYVNELLMLDNNLNDHIPVADKLRNLGVEDYKILNHMVDQGVAKEELFDEAIVTIQNKMQALQESASKIKPKDTKAIEKFYADMEELQSELEVASESKLNNSISEGKYQQELQNIYNNVFRMNILRNSVKGAVENQDQIIQKVDWKENWMYRDQLNDARQRAREQEKAAFENPALAESPSMNVKTLMTSVQGEGYKLFQEDLTNLTRLNKLEDTPENVAAKNEIKSRINNYKTTINSVLTDLVNAGLITKAELDKNYKEYVDKGGKNSKEYFYAQVMNDKSAYFNNWRFRKMILGAAKSQYGKHGTSLNSTPYEAIAYGNGLERNFDKIMKEYAKLNERTISESNIALRALNKDDAPVIFANNQQWQKAASRNELIWSANNMSLFDAIREYKLTDINGSVIKLDGSKLQFEVEMLANRLPNGKVGATVKLIKPDGTGYISDGKNPISFTVYAAPKANDYFEERYVAISNRLMNGNRNTTSPVVVQQGYDMAAETALWKHIRPVVTHPTLIQKGKEYTFNVPFQSGNNPPMNINYKIGREGEEYVLYFGDGEHKGKIITTNVEGRGQVPLRSSSPTNLGLLFDNYQFNINNNLRGNGQY